MRILHTVQLYHPHVGGSEEVVKQLSERLVRRGHQVTVATGYDSKRAFKTLNGVTVEQFRVSGNSVRGIEGADVEKYIDFVLNGKFDIIMNYAAQIWTSDLLFPHLQEIHCPKVFVPCGYSGLPWPEYQNYFEQLPAYLRQYDWIIYMSPNYRDKSFGDEHGVTHCSVIPNGTGESEFSHELLGFRRRFGIRTKYMLLCVANFYAAKGHLMVIEAFKGLKRKDTSLVIIGNPLEGSFKWRQHYYAKMKIEGWRTPRLKILENVLRPWVVSAFQEADLFVFGSQIECSPLVIFEAMAAKTPFVSTDCGDVKDYARFGIIVKDVQTMTGAISGSLNDDKRRTALGQAAHEFWKQHLTWESITDQYEKLYLGLQEQQSK